MQRVILSLPLDRESLAFKINPPNIEKGWTARYFTPDNIIRQVNLNT